MAESPDEFFTIQEMVDRSGLSRGGVLRRIQLGKIPRPVGKRGRLCLWRRADITDAMLARKNARAAQPRLPPIDDPNHIYSREAQKLLGISRSAIHKWMQNGRLPQPAGRQPGTGSPRPYWLRTEFEAWRAAGGGKRYRHLAPRMPHHPRQAGASDMSTLDIHRHRLAQIGIMQDVRLKGDTDPAWILRCRKCGGTHRHVAHRLHADAVVKHFAQQGWVVTGGKATCPSCRRAATRNPEPVTPTQQEMPMPAPLPPPQSNGVAETLPVAALVAVKPLLDQHYDEIGKSYRAPWTDLVVATQTGFSVQIVGKVREILFGPMEDPILNAIKNDVSTLRGMLGDLELRLNKAIELRR